MTAAVSSQVVVEVLSTSNPNVQSSQVVLEVLNTINATASSSQVVLEVLSSTAVNPTSQGNFFFGA